MVQLKKKVTIKTKIPQEETPAEVKSVVAPKPEEQTVNVPETPPTKNSKNWIWIVLALIAVVLLFLCYKSCDNSPAAEASDDQPTTQVDGNDDSVVVDENESEATSSNESDENVVSESEPNESEEEGTVAGNSETGSQTTAALSNSVQQDASSVSISGTLEEKAKAVIRGNYGNGLERKQKLGEEYAEIQSKVNEMYSNGLVK